MERGQGRQKVKGRVPQQGKKTTKQETGICAFSIKRQAVDSCARIQRPHRKSRIEAIQMSSPIQIAGVTTAVLLMLIGAAKGSTGFIALTFGSWVAMETAVLRQEERRQGRNRQERSKEINNSNRSDKGC